MRILISACLLGARCRYDGVSKLQPWISCGSGMVYDGTFTGVLTAGEGVTAELLRAQGIPVYGESRVAELADPI